MVFKINISDKGKTFKIELESEDFIGKKIGETLSGTDVLPGLVGYDLEISGTSDKSGFAGKKDVEGSGLKRVLLTKGPFFKKVANKGLRKKKTVRGNEISAATIQINLKVVKAGDKPLEQIFKKDEVVEESGEEKKE